MNSLSAPLCRASLLLLWAALMPMAGWASAPDPGAGDEVALRWDRRAVEHVWNRAGFGIADEDLDRWVKEGPHALVDFLLAPRPLVGQEIAPPFKFVEPRIDPVEFEQRTLDERREYRTIRTRVFRREIAKLRATWVRRMVAGEDPLRDRMTLFWHGVFTSSYTTVKHPLTISMQHESLRARALGSYELLLRAMLRDPAMLMYLNNDKNRKGKPNENLAREVMELFSLGEGSGYTEEDVREAARALTGAGVDRKDEGGEFRFSDRHHDGGEKTILGVQGQHGLDDLATILLAQPECAEFIAKSIIEYLEGVDVAPDRLDAYAQSLRATDYDIAHFLRKLLLDPAFYSDEVIGARVASPIDFVVGTRRRMVGGVPTRFLFDASAALGQEVFQPPNVKGWEGGLAWISTAAFMLRGNIAGAMLGRVNSKSIRKDAAAFIDELAESGEMSMMSEDEMAEMGKAQSGRDEMSRLVKVLRDAKWKPRGSFVQAVRATGAESDAEITKALADQLLAIEPPVETLRMLEGRLAALRQAKKLRGANFLKQKKKAEPILRELAHLILSLPEAQLH